jgi:6-pyruvoyl-tetrahydropterin synthase
MVLDLKELKAILKREIVEPYDHRFLNYEVPPFDREVPTTENIALDIWRRLEPRLNRRPPQTSLPSASTRPRTCMWITSENQRVPRDPAVRIRCLAPPAFQ